MSNKDYLKKKRADVVRLNGDEPSPTKIFKSGNCYTGEIANDTSEPRVDDYSVELDSGNIHFSGNLFTGQVGSDTEVNPRPLHVLDMKDEGCTHEQTLHDLQQKLIETHAGDKSR